MDYVVADELRMDCQKSILNFAKWLPDFDNQTLPKYDITSTIMCCLDAKNQEIQIRSLFSFAENDLQIIKLKPEFGDIGDVKFGPATINPSLFIVSVKGNFAYY